MVQERWRHGGKVGQILVKESRKMGVTYHLATPAAVHAENDCHATIAAPMHDGETRTSHHIVASSLSLLVDFSTQEAEAESLFQWTSIFVDSNSTALEQFGSCPRHASVTPRRFDRGEIFLVSGHVTSATNQTSQASHSGQGLTHNGPRRSKADTVSAMQRHFFHRVPSQRVEATYHRREPQVRNIGFANRLQKEEIKDNKHQGTDMIGFGSVDRIGVQNPKHQI
ncbi:hypothetical protein GX48_03224 [Paracoccidioides brasiliensis]|nr:hypothetical protein GX48_03224 [Paracoccidioides brasiliensis]